MPYIPPKTLPPGTTQNLQPIKSKMPSSLSTSRDQLQSESSAAPEPDRPVPLSKDTDDLIDQLANTTLSPAPIDPPQVISATPPIDVPSTTSSRSLGASSSASTSQSSGSASSGTQHSSSPPSDADAENPLMRYREGLYAYTVRLSLSSLMSCPAMSWHSTFDSTPISPLPPYYTIEPAQTLTPARAIPRCQTI